ncbi:MAG: hypothetical protein U9Q82_08080 [Chloroflexota bacterium]|nr:hypothetical protein [Chloroflexota bacterium]
MTDDKIRLEAKFDQINASHRDALESIRRASEGLFQMPEEDRREILDQLRPWQRWLFLEIANEINDTRLIDALMEENT